MIVKLLRQCPVAYSTEKEMQEGIAAYLTRHSIEYQREYRLDSHNRIDFLIGDIGVECKTKGPAMRVFRQCERYCTFDEIKTLVLFTSFHMNLPDTINGRETHVIKPGIMLL